jgi:hypothetical protein
MKRFTSGTGLAGGGIAITGVGATIATVPGGISFGFGVIAAGGAVLLVGFFLLVLGFRAYFSAQSTLQAAAEARESARDARQVEASKVDAERLDLQRESVEMERQKLTAAAAVRSATTPEQKAEATAATLALLTAELRSLKAQADRQDSMRRMVGVYDEPQAHLMIAEMEVSQLRIDEIEFELAELRRGLPDKAQRQREAIEGLNQIVRGL